MTAPVTLYTLDPDITTTDKASRFPGGPLFEMTVDTQGHPTNLHFLRSTTESTYVQSAKPDKRLTAAALARDRKTLEAIKQGRFKPATC
jgi:hypothetical protein